MTDMQLIGLVVGGSVLCWFTGYCAGVVYRAIKQFFERATRL